MWDNVDYIQWQQNSYHQQKIGTRHSDARGESFSYSKKSKGSRMGPQGTPHLIGLKSDVQPH